MVAAQSDPTAALVYDVAVIGAGVVGSAIARDLAAFDLSIALVDARDDVGDGTSKANTAILHTGFDARPGSLESTLMRRGHQLLGDYAVITGIPVEYVGALLVAWTPEELDVLPDLRVKSEQNGYDRCELVDRDEVYRQVPDLGEGALGGLTVPDEAIICPWTVTLALATEARMRGVDVLLRRHITSVEIGAETTTLHHESGRVVARWVVNAAGLGSDLVDTMFGHQRFTITPRRGELFVFDKLARGLVDRIVLPVPSTLGKGVLISPTIYGNVMLGPTAEDLSDRTATGTSEAGLTFLRAKGERLMPKLMAEEVTASYAGLRAAGTLDDYLIEATPQQRYVLVGGVRSTGITSSMAIAEHVVGQLDRPGVALNLRDDLPDAPTMPNLGEAFPRPYQDGPRVADDPAYGQIVCFCERVTAGEIRDAFASPIPPSSIEGLRRRTRAMNGRCQGFYCGAAVAAGVDQNARTEADLAGLGR
jgi:glycerol-3-phosphate dehydrogenase